MIQNISEFQKSSNKSSNSLKRVIAVLFLASLSAMLWNYLSGFNQSIDWEVTTSAEVIQFPALVIEGDLMDHTINSDKYVLQERYSGTKIQRNLQRDQIYLGIIWLGVCLFLAISSYFNRYMFFAVVAAFALMINRLNLFEIGFFGIYSKLVMMIPFLAIIAPTIYFHEFKKSAPLHVRFVALLVISICLAFGIDDPGLFTDHFIAHSLFPFALASLLFLFIVSEEIVYGLLHVVTSSKGGKSNHLHFIVLSLIYLGNLVLYYLNKSGLFENSFFFFDPFILLIITTLIAWWSLKFKDKLVENYMPSGFLMFVFFSLGIVTFSFLSLQMSRGMDGVYQSMHYFILYFHIGFGVLFLLYIIANFIDPLIKGFEVYKIVYRERNFPYVTAKLGGLVCIAAFYFLASQEPYNLLRSGYFNYLSVKETKLDNHLLAKEYLNQAGFLGYNTHYPNYQMAWLDWGEGKQFRAKTNFFNAAQRFPSPYAWVNYGNMESEFNPNKVQATYEESLRKMNSPEMENNLGLIHFEKDEIDKALSYFENNEASNDWNQAPSVNKWAIYNQLRQIDSSNIKSDYVNGNHGVKANILSVLSGNHDFGFETDQLDLAKSLHRQAYLLNASHLFDHDSIASFLRREIDRTALASRSNRLSKALAIYLYKKGEVSDAFRVLDNIQLNSHDYYKGEYLDILGKLALDQGAYRLANEYFAQAIKLKNESSRVSNLEALAGLNKIDAFKSELLKIVKNDPGLTQSANGLLDKLETYSPSLKSTPNPDLASMDVEQIIHTAGKNAFNEELLLNAVTVLNEKEASGGYELLVNSLEVNPYSVRLLQAYIYAALEWNLIDYADQSLERLSSLMEADEFSKFKSSYDLKKEELTSDEW